MVEIAYLARRTRFRCAKRWNGYGDAGLIPARGGAEIFTSASGASSAITRSTAASGLDAARRAHSWVLRSNCTMLYRHMKTKKTA